jgi:hypothetical protein
MAGESLVFRKAKPRSSAGDPSETRSHIEDSHMSPFGGLRGTVRIAVDFDVAEPTGEIWAAD